MKKDQIHLKPAKIIKIIGYTFMFLPVIYPLFFFLLFNIPAENIQFFIADSKFYALSALSILSGIGIIKLKRWCWNIFLTTAILVAILNYYMIFSFSESSWKLLLYVSSLVILLSIIFLVKREIKVPHFFPKILWWENDPRMKFHVTSEIIVLKNTDKQTNLVGDILDISKKGCFIKTNDKFSLGEHVTLKFKLYGNDIAQNGEISMISERTVTRPKGIGVRFIAQSIETKKLMKDSIKKMKIERKKLYFERKSI